MSIAVLASRRLGSVVGIVLITTTLTAALPSASAGETTGQDAFARGLPASADNFPIAVWLQAPRNAVRYKQIGINLYVGLWQGPNEQQLVELEKAGIPVICDQNSFALENQDRKIIVGWMHGDEPDNAQALPGGKGWGPPILPEKIVEDYQRIRKADPTRPVLLNLGQGVAWDGWYGRGVRSNKPEDYPKYVQGCDIVSFDIYPAVHDRKEIAGNLWYVPKGVERLRRWTEGRKPVWSCIECTRIGNEKVKPTPHQVKAEVWMAIIHGARGLIYFSHQFKPTFIEAGLLADKEMATAVGQINRQVRELAPVINSHAAVEGATVRSASKEVPIAIMARRHERATYILAVAMREGSTTGTFHLPGRTGRGTVRVIDENRTIDMADGQWQDAFGGYDVRLFRIED